MRLFLVALVWWFTCSGSHAQTPCTGKVRCTVVDAASLDRIPYAGFVMLASGKFLTSNSDGILQIDSVCDDGMLVRTLMIGFQPDTFMVLPGRGVQRLALRSSVRSLAGTEVTASRIEGQAVQATDSIGQKDLDRSSGKPLADVLDQLNGLSTLRTGQQVVKPVIHGLHSQRIVIMHAGVRLEGQQWGTEHAPEIDPFAAGRITVIKGGSALRYGADAVGGVILIEPPEIEHLQGIRAVFNAVGMSNGRQGIVSGLAEQHLGRFFDVCWRVQGTLKRGGNVNTPDFFLDNTGVKEYNYSASLGIERKRFGAETYFSGFNAVNGIFSGAHIGNSTDLERIISTGETLTSDTFSYAIGRPRQTVHHSLLSARVWYAVPGLGTFTARLGSQLNQRQEFDRDRPYSDSLAALDQPELELKLKTRTVDLLYESGAFRGYTLLSGATVFIQDNQYGGLRYFVPNYRLENLGMFVLGRKRMNKFELELGVRYDYRTQQVYRNSNGMVVRDDYGFRFPNFSLGAIWRPDSSQQLKFQVGSARRAPSINEWFSNGLHHGTATFETGDPSLGLEKAWSASMSWKRTGRNASAELAAYALFVDDYIYLVPSDQPVLTLSGAFPAFRYTGVDARMAGVDAAIEWQITSAFQAAFNGNLVLAENISANEPLELMPAPRIGTELQYVFRDAGRWSGRNLQVSYRRVFRQKRIPQSTADAPAPDAYGLTDIAIEGTINASKSAVWLSLGIDNLFNVRYRDYLNRLRYYSDEMGRNFIIRMRIPLNFNTRAHDHQH